VAGPGLPAPTVDTLIYGAWVGFVEMGITFLLWQRALKLSRHAARIGQLIFLSPFISLVLIGTVLGETIHVTSWIGLGIIVAGLLVTGRPRPTDKRIE
ncbi:MAG: EamA family transporter, partial [Gammaproteobacteria bacterium]